MYLKFLALVATFALFTGGGQAKAECSAQLDGPPFTVLPAYNPFAPADIFAHKNLQIRHLVGTGCQYRIAFRRNPAVGAFSDKLRYSVGDDQSQSLLVANAGPGNSRFLLSSPASAGMIQSVGYVVNVERGQIASPGVLVDRIEVVLLSENGQTEINSRDFYIWIQVESISMVNIAGGGPSTTVQFGNLITGMTRSLILEARSNIQYTISFESTNKGKLELDPPVAGRAWSIPYRLSVDGAAFDLSQQNYIQRMSSTSGKQSHSLAVQIIDANEKRAGRYRDVITAKITPTH